MTTTPAHPVRRARGAAPLLVLPVVLVNVVAVWGQVAWARTALGGWLAAVLFAAAVESIALFLAFHAHRARLAGDASAGLRLGALAAAAVVAGINYSHWASPSGAPTVPAIAFAFLSLLSPVLWGVHTTARRRDELRAAGRIDAAPPRFSAVRWLLHPGPTWRALRLAVLRGITDPAEAAELAAAPPPPDPDPAPPPRRAGRGTVDGTSRKAIPARGDVPELTRKQVVRLWGELARDGVPRDPRRGMVAEQCGLSIRAVLDIIAEHNAATDQQRSTG